MPSPTVTIMFGDLRIVYRLRHSDRKKTVSIAVDPRQGVLVTAPHGLDAERVHLIVSRKGRWIAERLGALQDVNGGAYEREFVSGESFPYLGRNYRLKVIPHAKTGTSLRRLVVSLYHDGYTPTSAKNAKTMRLNSSGFSK